MLRANLREYCPAPLAAFGSDLAGRDALAVLAAAPGPVTDANLTQSRIETLLRRVGRRRYLAKRAQEIVAALRSEQLPARSGIETAYTATTTVLVAVITEISAQVTDLQGKVEACLGQHPEAEVYLSGPGLGGVLGTGARRVRGRSPPLH
ncbi:hypothetical protein JOJ87_001203 [Rhodococcus ruber]|uniref:hypothetical protein n=1 Tax=Rhodococcus ruber TaxID=1830 RepID=UPI001AE89A25|nr:hypothetical protein [Rhodococcus ruber]MBP2210859.1 hypothetical protein [Rhodococcus ruber]